MVRQTEGVKEPLINKETMAGFRFYGKENDEGDVQHISLWAVHGPEDGRRIEYPVVSYTEGATNYSSIDQDFGEMDGKLVPDDFYEFVAGQAARLVEEGKYVFHDIFAFIPDEWDDYMGWGARQLLLMTTVSDTLPMELVWAIERGIDDIEESMDIEDLEEIEET